MKKHRVQDRPSPVSMGIQRRIARIDETQIGPWVEMGTTAAAWKAYKKMRKADDVKTKILKE